MKRERRNVPAAWMISRPVKMIFCFVVIVTALICFSCQSSLAQSTPTKKPRIISLYAAHTEVVIRIGAKDSLVGVSEQETYNGPEVQGWTWPMQFSVKDDVEKFLAAAPDIILIRPQHLGTAPHLFDTLKNSGIQVWVKQIIDASDLYNYWTEIGEICGHQKEAQAMIEDFKAKIAPFEENLNKPNKPGVFLESIYREIKTFTPNSIPEWILGLAGGDNIAKDALPSREGLMVANYGPEKLLEKAEQIEVFISQEGPMNRVSLETMKARDVYQILPAFKNGRVYKIPENIISRPTPSLFEGLQMMHGFIYPEESSQQNK
ncbi:MAG: ABC transporter substrate-binding protein [Deltaproteobacteria bacterium]|nr:ABC transporter substrate-binding protein [Deltaproteobacteria bacterium]